MSIDTVEVTVSLSKLVADTLEGHHTTLSLDEIVRAYVNYAAAEIVIAERSRRWVGVGAKP